MTSRRRLPLVRLLLPVAALPLAACRAEVRPDGAPDSAVVADSATPPAGVPADIGADSAIALARAFLKDAPVLLLDEPTSALDSDSEARVTSSIFDLMRGRTTLIVAHRLSTIRRVDKVLVLERGVMTEFGTREELLGRGGYFSRMMAGSATR